MPAARYYALLSQNELDVETLMREIRADEIRFRRAPAEDRPRIRKRAEEKLSRLERLTERQVNGAVMRRQTKLSGISGQFLIVFSDIVKQLAVNADCLTFFSGL